MSALNIIAMLIAAFVAYRTAVDIVRRARRRFTVRIDLTGSDTGTLPRINRRKPFTSYTP